MTSTDDHRGKNIDFGDFTQVDKVLFERLNLILCDWESTGLWYEHDNSYDFNGRS